MAHSAIMSVRITGNADDAVKAFEKTTTKAAAFGSAIGGLAVKGVTALWDTVKGFAGDVVNMSDSTDKFMNTMSFAGIDTKAVQAAAKETRKYADDTVYGLDDIQNTTAQLAANGIGNYMELTEAAGNLNAVAGGNADSFKSVAMMLTQTAGAGKLTTENWNQLADAIPGASGKLQEALLKNGAYTGNFRDAMSKGEITADEFNKALMDLGMTDVAKQAATSTSTIEGAMGNLEAAVTTAMQVAAVAQAVLNAVMAANPIMLVITLIAALTAVLTYFFTCTNTGRAVWSSFTSFLGSCVQGITGFFSGLGSTIVGIFSSAANGARNAWNGVVGWFRGLPGTIGGFFSNAGSILVNAGASIINGFWDGLKGAWNNVTGWISGIGDWIKAHKGPISYDRRLLIPAGQAIMTGFAQGLNTGFDSNVETAIGRANRRLAAMPLNLSAQGTTATPAVINTWNVEINGEVIDKDGTAKAIKRLLADYDARRS